MLLVIGRYIYKSQMEENLLFETGAYIFGAINEHFVFVGHDNSWENVNYLLIKCRWVATLWLCQTSNIYTWKPWSCLSQNTNLKKEFTGMLKKKHTLMFLLKVYWNPNIKVWLIKFSLGISAEHQTMPDLAIKFLIPFHGKKGACLVFIHDKQV